MSLLNRLGLFLVLCICTRSSNAAPLSITGKFQSWFPFYAEELDAASVQCKPELEAYWSDGKNATIPYAPGTLCINAQSCLLDALPEYSIANMGSSTVLLGLAPAILGLVGPTLPDTSVLMIQRPILSSLVLLGAPAMNPITLFSNTNVEDVLLLKPSAIMVALQRSILSWRTGQNGVKVRISTWKTAIISAAQYLLALAAVANTIHNTVMLDLGTSVSWRCSSFGLPLLWNTLSVPISWLAAIGLWYRVGSFNGRKGSDAQLRTNSRAFIRRFITSEHVPCLFQPQPAWNQQNVPPTVVSDLTYLAACLLLLVIYGFGTLVFSSLLFVAVNDSAIVLLRYAISACCCRFLLWFELESMRLWAGEKYDAEELDMLSGGESHLQY
ncbi:hypothetical protein JX266_002160 [Neoarthrinium moseri]|nr:hypothetical protein JX266_002160 [Neoarthrinium moseri]